MSRERKSGESIRSTKGKASIVFALGVLVFLGAGGAYLQVTDQWKVVTGAAELKYREFVEEVVNDPDNEEYRAELIARVVKHYRETPAKKSLPLRNDDGHIIGRFRINVAAIEQPHKESPDPALRRIYTVDLAGGGELWHETGERVRFNATAHVTYQVDFEVEDWAAYAYFECVEVAKAKFECTHIDHILGQLFMPMVRDAGTEALNEALMPGFTIIAKSNGDTYLAAGRVGREFQPRVGPYEETDLAEEFETIYNDTSLINAEFRDYLGPFELFDEAELRITMEVESLEPAKSCGIDVYLLTEAQFQAYESFYPHQMDELRSIDNLDARIDMQKLNMSRDDLTGNIYILIDYTGWGSGKDPDDRAEAGLVRYYVRVKR